MQLVFDIPDAKAQRAINAIAARHPIPQKADGTDEFTKAAWAKEYLRRLVVREVFAFERDRDGQATQMDDGIIA